LRDTPVARRFPQKALAIVRLEHRHILPIRGYREVMERDRTLHIARRMMRNHGNALPDR
jgi:hypothetical protein